jgi:diguanylate cyclase (GGDEF)-like protein
VANTLRSSLRRPDDFIVRYGGEEFLVFPASAPVDVAAELAERLRVTVEQLPMEAPLSEERRRVTISAGVAGLDSISKGTVADVMERADRALYAAKKAGRNRVVCADA